MTTILEAQTLLKEMLTSQGKSENTVRAYLTDFKQFHNYCLMGRIDPNNLIDRDWFAFYALDWVKETRAHVAPPTTIRRIAALRALARAVKYPEPFVDYKPPVAARGMAHPLPEGPVDTIKLIEQANTKEERCLVALCGEVGCRVSEALSIRGCDFDYNGTMWIATIRGKGDKARKVPVPESAWALIEPVIERSQGPWMPLLSYHERTARRIITRLGIRAGLSREIASHDLRMTYGSAVYDASKDLRATQELLGHASSATTEGYTRVRDEAKVSAVMGAFGASR
jgi:integrase/recombinase XerC